MGGGRRESDPPPPPVPPLTRAVVQFQMKPPAETIAEATKDLIQPGEVLFIATDERKKEFFNVFTQNHR